MKWPPYSDYKYSGTPWLGSLPTNWRVIPLKFAARVFPSNVDKHSHDNEIPVELCNYTDVYHYDVIDQSLRFMQATATLDEIRKFTLQAGDTIITKDSETADDIGLSAYVPESLDGVVCGYHLSTVRPNSKLLGRFAKRLFDSHYVKALLETNAQGLTRVGLGQYALDNLDVPLPPVDEQTAITNFLDRETAKIDALIDKQEQLVATLREDRTATITHAVTKGLNPDVEMKDSGVEWLGEIPRHWWVDRLKRAVVSSRNGVWGNDAEGSADDIRCVRVADFDRAALTVHDESITYRRVTVNERSGRVLRKGDLLLEKSGGGDNNPVGFVVLYDRDEPAVCSNFVARVKLEAGQIPKYWLYANHCLYASRLTSRSIKQNTGIQNLDQASYFNERVTYPPTKEQQSIAEYLDGKCARIDALIAKATEMIATLKEYRSTVITSAVTGKIDFREAA